MPDRSRSKSVNPSVIAPAFRLSYYFYRPLLKAGICLEDAVIPSYDHSLVYGRLALCHNLTNPIVDCRLASNSRRYRPGFVDWRDLCVGCSSSEGSATTDYDEYVEQSDARKGGSACTVVGRDVSLALV